MLVRLKGRMKVETAVMEAHTRQRRPGHETPPQQEHSSVELRTCTLQATVPCRMSKLCPRMSPQRQRRPDEHIGTRRPRLNQDGLNVIDQRCVEVVGVLEEADGV